MNDYHVTAKLRYLQPLSEAQLRAIWEQSLAPDVKTLLWEIKRLQSQLVGLHITCIGQLSGSAGAASTMETYARTLLSEPAVKNYWRARQPADERDNENDWAYALANRLHDQAAALYTGAASAPKHDEK